MSTRDRFGGVIRRSKLSAPEYAGRLKLTKNYAKRQGVTAFFITETFAVSPLSILTLPSRNAPSSITRAGVKISAQTLRRRVEDDLLGGANRPSDLASYQASRDMDLAFDAAGFTDHELGDRVHTAFDSAIQAKGVFELQLAADHAPCSPQIRSRTHLRAP